MDATEMAATFNPTRDAYARIAPQLWDPAGTATVRRTKPQPGERVLDACCGIGSSALPAAHAVAPGGAVDAVDVAGALLTQGRTTAQRLGLTNINFIEADLATWKPDGTRYDLIQCVFGVFLLPDLDRDAAHLVNLLRAGGRLGVTVWAKGALETFARALYEIVTRHRPEQADRPAFGAPIERINTEPLLHTWLTSLGLRDITIHTHPTPCNSPQKPPGTSSSAPDSAVYSTASTPPPSTPSTPNSSARSPNAASTPRTPPP